MYRVMYRPRPSAPWESCCLVSGGRAKAVVSARQIAEQEDALNGRGQVGVMEEAAKKVTIISIKREGV